MWVAQLEALAKLCGKEEGFDDIVLLLVEAKKRMQKVLETACEADKVSEEGVFDGVLALGRAYRWIEEWDECEACLERAMMVSCAC